MSTAVVLLCLSAALFYTVNYLTTIIHELGHAFAYRRNGRRLVRIEFGRGPGFTWRRSVAMHFGIGLSGRTYYVNTHKPMPYRSNADCTASGLLLHLAASLMAGASVAAGLGITAKWWAGAMVTGVLVTGLVAANCHIWLSHLLSLAMGLVYILLPAGLVVILASLVVWPINAASSTALRTANDFAAQLPRDLNATPYLVLGSCLLELGLALISYAPSGGDGGRLVWYYAHYHPGGRAGKLAGKLLAYRSTQLWLIVALSAIVAILVAAQITATL